QTAVIRRRAFSPDLLPRGCRVLVASGRAALTAGRGFESSLAEELAHLRLVLDAAEEAGAERVVVLGSADVAGGSEVIDGRAPQGPRTRYAHVKAALEDECVIRHDRGLPVTSVRLAPVHGPGKRRSHALLRCARL